MKLIIAAFWVEDEDRDAAFDVIVGETVPGIPGSGAVVSFDEKVAHRTDFKRTLARFNLREPAYYEGSP